MAKRKRRRKIRLTPFGYAVLGGVALLTVVTITVLCTVGRAGADRMTPPSTASPTLAIDEPSASPVQESPEPTAVPARTPTIAASGVTMPTETQIAQAVDGRLNASGVVLRQGPSSSAQILETYASGALLKIYASEGEYYFCQVVDAQEYGYIAAKFVVKFGLLPGETGTPVPAAPDGAFLGIVTAEKGVSLRSVPSTSGNSPIGECVCGELVNVYFKTGDFYYIQVPGSGLYAYAYAQFIVAGGKVPVGTPAP